MQPLNFEYNSKGSVKLHFVTSNKHMYNRLKKDILVFKKLNISFLKLNESLRNILSLSNLKESHYFDLHFYDPEHSKLSKKYKIIFDIDWEFSLNYSYEWENLFKTYIENINAILKSDKNINRHNKYIYKYIEFILNSIKFYNKHRTYLTRNNEKTVINRLNKEFLSDINIILSAGVNLMKTYKDFYKPLNPFLKKKIKGMNNKYELPICRYKVKINETSFS